MTFDIEYNFTISYCDGYVKGDYPLITLYLALPLRVILSLVIILSATSVLLAIKNSRRAPLTLHFFFIANLMIADIGVAVIHNGAAILNMILTIANPTREGTNCSIIAATGFPAAADSMMLVVLCFDRLYSVTAPHHYRRNKTKTNGYVIVSAIWLESLLIGFLSFTDPHLSITKTNDAICDDPLFKAIIVPLILSTVLVVIQNIYIYYSEVKATTRSNTNKSSMTVAGALKTMEETKKESIILLVLSGTSMALGLFHPVISPIMQHMDGIIYAIWFALNVPCFYSFSVFLHGVLYENFLDSIHESL